MPHNRPVGSRLSKATHRTPQAGPVVRAQSKQSILVPLSRRALLQRIGRTLARDGRRLKKTRAPSARERVGDYYITDSGEVVAHHINLEQLGQELGVIETYERLLVED